MSVSARGTPAAETALDNPVAEQAIGWMVLLHSGDATPDDYHRFTRWHGADPRHAQAWARLQGVQRSLVPIRDMQARTPGQDTTAERILLRPAPSAARRKVLRGTLALAAVGVAGGALLQRTWPLAGLGADLHTGTGERRRFDLPDGSSLILNARSSADVEFSAGQRRVRLRQGELIATVAADAARPFIVETPHGTARALGTRFLVRREDGRSLALVLEHSIEIDSGDAHARQVLHPGQAAYYRAGEIERVDGDASGRAAWADGMLVANDEPLGEVVAALRPYRRGFIRISPAAARLRVLGAFPLDDTDNVLRSLEQTMPLQVRQVGGLLVLIDIRAGA